MTELNYFMESYFGVINQTDLENIVSFFESKTVKKDTLLLQAGQNCNHLSFVQSGFFRMFAYSDKNEVTQWIASKGYFVVDLASFLTDNSAKWNIQALTDGELLTISKDNYKKLHAIVPKWKELERLFLVNCFAAMEQRIFTHLSMTAEERYVHFYNNNKELFNQVPLQNIASMLGMTPETFSRIRKKLAY